MTPSPSALALLTPDEMAAVDRAAIAGGASGPALMRAAGAAVARALRKRFRPCRTLILAGPGNNGGDGYVVARLLEREGWPVSVAALAPPRPGSDAAMAAAEWRGPVLPFTPETLARAQLVVDALFGAGLSRELDGPAAAALRAVRVPLVAVDVPSGLDGATGEPRGFAPQAALTVTFGRLKPGHLLLPGRELCGEVVLADIGLPEAALASVAPRAFRNAPGLWRLPERGAQHHKFSHGHVTIPGGAAMPGAARLAAMSARRIGAGLVTLAAEDTATATLFRQGEPGLLVSAPPPEDLLADERRSAWVLGPGLPPRPETLALLRRVVEAGRHVVADGGALTAAAGQPHTLQGAAILTPHAGEFAKVFGALRRDRLAAARMAAAVTGAVVVLKGSDSIIAAPDGRAAINNNAPPALATAGSGDVLAGLAGGLLAQNLPPFEAACAAAWLHGQAATLALAGAAPGTPLVAEDLLPQLRAAWIAATR
ncbi:NAD(P)H-hydrate dehydratase [Pseudoroseomonas ludipueritiae]|uniref:Bifunctional NAD(P)H-hydrate repair enzyme n=1 Tax=Pseudoroseomonas ludipueritiae TaxID=198093 RepID=A0ABR7RCM3_9PROT|nr:NAD(P)H-hydrate dehydratase [Pseudoroseomonas ludipueritiae]MBC9179429.1 NAD(P)H-hydrate dehydratase [Pseudoroseomonas ludipueritiae]